MALEVSGDKDLAMTLALTNFVILGKFLKSLVGISDKRKHGHDFLQFTKSFYQALSHPPLPVIL